MKELIQREEEYKDVWRDLLSLLGEINRLVDAIIVEGQRDSEALRTMGLTKPIYRSSTPERSHSDLVEELAENHSRVVILTDFDEEGRDLNRRLSYLLEHRGLRVEKSYRRSVGRLLRELKITTIESLRKLKGEMRS